MWQISVAVAEMKFPKISGGWNKQTKNLLKRQEKKTDSK